MTSRRRPVLLRTYGFLENEENHQQSSLLDNATALSEALSLFQEYYGLSGNGVLTVETIRVMRMPRCGVADIRAYSPLTRKWPRAHLTWNFKLANRGTLRTTQSAFSLWSEQSTLTFSRDSLRPDILISYQSGAHAYENSDNGGSCPSPFAGPGSVVAHAFFPTGEPDQVTEVHVDETEPWHITLTKPSSDRLYLLQTLTHEIGHTLGLTHSTRDDSVMYAYTPSEERRYPLRLSVEDVVNVRNLYGSRETTTPRIVDATRPTTAATTATTTTTASTTTTAAAAQSTTARTVEPPLAPSDTADLCALRRVDGALIMNRRLYVIYNDDKIAEMNDCAMTVARHGVLRDTFSGIPPAMTAAFRHVDGNLYFLKKRDYYAYSEFLDAIISAGPFDLSILGIECPADGILHRLSELVSKLYRLEYASFERPRNDDDDDDD
ncbi:matrix metalloproteinase-24-like [Camponotus floridanus]|uniref:matrix metalloproteinase-24-like n=1 Tax=Camponotus floridanus TaxID=104421 RepID=UPI000DC6A783|nr:matrix metalloproteinase-24-like [Camponotus floridanus]